MRCGKALVLGGSGFIGRHLVAALSARGVEVIVPTRRSERAKHLIVLPTVEVVEADIGRAGTIERLAADCDALINLVGVLHSRHGRPDERGPNDYGPEFALAHVEIAQAAVAACRARGIARLLHMSALGAGADAPSEYLRSKWIGEQAVLAAEDLQVAVFRPAVVFGPEDHFLNLFARLARALPVLMVACPQARLQPVYVGDVAQAFLAALEDRQARERRYDLCGPQSYRLLDLVRYVCALQHRRRLVVGLSDRLSYAMARLLEWTPGPLMTRDNYRSLQVDSVCANALPFGVEAHRLEAMAPAWLLPPRS